MSGQVPKLELKYWKLRARKLTHRNAQERVYLVDVGVQTVMHVPNQDNEQPVSCEEPVGDPCTTAKFGANLDFHLLEGTTRGRF